MRLQRLKIEKFKNLRDFEITFDQDSPYTVLVGQNGSGKSNLFEAILAIFDSLEDQVSPGFVYALQYACRGYKVLIEYPGSGPISFTFGNANGTPVVDRYQIQQLGNFERHLLPEFVFGYYSGLCGRFEHYFATHSRRYTVAARGARPGEGVRRRFLYGSLSYTEFVLIALWAHSFREDRPSCVLDALDVKAVDDILLTIKPAKRYDPNVDTPLSMGLKGLVREFVAELDLAAEGVPSASGTGRKMRQEYRYRQDGLMQLAEFAEKRNTNLFDLLLETQREGALGRISCSISLRNGDRISVDDLSEGEKQLLLVMGMLRFAEHDEALFLLDEPDTHLNPRWSLSYIDMIEEELGHAPKSHIIMATHDPLVLTDLKASQVRILRRGRGARPVTASPPYADPKEMGVDGLLTSELFDLSAPIGTEVQKMIYERTVLLGKGDKRTTKETQDMQDLSQKLDRMGFAKVFDDPIYTQFVTAMGKRPEFMKPMLTPEEMAAQEDYASQVLDEIMEGEGE